MMTAMHDGMQWMPYTAHQFFEKRRKRALDTLLQTPYGEHCYLPINPFPEMLEAMSAKEQARCAQMLVGKQVYLVGATMHHGNMFGGVIAVRSIQQNVEKRIAGKIHTLFFIHGAIVGKSGVVFHDLPVTIGIINTTHVSYANPSQ